MVKVPAATLKALQSRLNGPTRHKYGAKRSKCLYGHDHDSRKEADWCLKLHQLQKEEKIGSLILQPPYELVVNGFLIAVHQPDFTYVTYKQYPICGASVMKGTVHVVEVKGKWKGALLPVWKLKYKLFCALYPDINYQIV